MAHFMRSLGHALRGVWAVFKEERNFKIQVSIAILVLFFAVWFKFSYAEITILVLAITMVLGAEIVNTAIEDFCNMVELREDPMIRKIKDMTAGLVLVSACSAFVLGILTLIHHFWGAP